MTAPRQQKTARWVVLCPECNQDFPLQPEIELPDDLFGWLGLKPKLPESGLLLECPNCKKSSVFVEKHLGYR